jgi:hypothetical protein
MNDTYTIKADFYVIPDPAGTNYNLELVYHGMIVYTPDGKWERIFKTIPEDAAKDLADAHLYLIGCSKGVREDQTVRHYMLLASTTPDARNQLFIDQKARHPLRDLKWHRLKDAALADATLETLETAQSRKAYISTMYATKLFSEETRTAFIEDVYAQWEWRRSEERLNSITD